MKRIFTIALFTFFILNIGIGQIHKNTKTLIKQLKKYDWNHISSYDQKSQTNKWLLDSTIDLMSTSKTEYTYNAYGKPILAIIYYSGEIVGKEACGGVLCPI